MTNWQPIETAPKDGTWILLYDGQRICMGRYEVARYPIWETVDEDTQKRTGWNDYSKFYGLTEEGFELHANMLTHWQPLPDPPADHLLSTGE